MSALQDWGQGPASVPSQRKTAAVQKASKRCNNCPKTIFFARSPNGRKLPFDLEKAQDVTLTPEGELIFVLRTSTHKCEPTENQEPADVFAMETVHGVEIPKHEADAIRATNADPEMALIKAAHSEAMRQCFNHRSVPEAQKLWDSDAYFEIRDAYFNALDLRKPKRSVEGVGFQREERKR